MRDAPLNLKPWQVRAAHDGQLSALVVPIPQAPIGEGGHGWSAESIGDQLVVQSPGYTLDGGRTVVERVVPLPLVIGRRYWARETHSIVPCTAYRQSVGVQQTVSPDAPHIAAVYRAEWERSAPLWRPSTQMPRWASRITIVPTSLRVCRLHVRLFKTVQR
jgi:hypothetical protein